MHAARHASRAIVWFGAVVALASCGGDGPSGGAKPVATVEVTSTAAAVAVGASVTLTAVARDADGGTITGRAPGWTLTPGYRTLITATQGVTITVRGTQEGTETVRATIDGKSGEVVLTVTPAPVARVEVVSATTQLVVGATTQLGARFYSASNEQLLGRSVTWSSANEAIARVSTDGLVTAVGEGTTVLRATSEGAVAELTITVSPAPVARIAVTGVAPLLVGGTLTLSARTYSVQDVELMGRAIAWSSTNENVATVTQAGVVTGVGAGTVQVRATSEQAEATVAIAVQLPPLGPMTQVVSGMWHSCGLKADGMAWCWGANAQGQLGDGTATMRSSATRVAGGHTFTSLAAGRDHTCGVTVAGGVLCWGDNLYGQLGDGTSTMRTVPTPVIGLPAQVRAVATGASLSCAVAEAGGATWCWGSSGYGQAGLGAAGADHIPPTAVTGGNVFSTVTLGGNHACGVAATDVRCWGANFYGMVGDATSIDRYAPVAVSGAGAQMGQVVAGEGHSCGLATNGVARCWGHNGERQLGTLSPTPSFSTVPLAVDMPSGVQFTSIFSGTASFHTCGINASGAAWCWGSNIVGQLGDGTTTTRIGAVAVQLNGLSIAQVATGQEHTCVLANSGDAYCWGDNRNGQLGDGTRVPRLAPTMVRRAQ